MTQKFTANETFNPMCLAVMPKGWRARWAALKWLLTGKPPRIFLPKEFKLYVHTSAGGGGGVGKLSGQSVEGVEAL